MNNKIIINGLNINCRNQRIETSSYIEDILNNVDYSVEYKRKVLGKMLLNKILKENFSIMENQLDFVYFNGKPFLRDYENIKFNISHDGEWIFCACGNNNIGIDIQDIRKGRLDIAKRFFDSNEYDYIKKSIRSDERFSEIWTLKESFVKCTGEGLSRPLNSFCFVKSNGMIELYQNGKLDLRYSFLSWRFSPDYYMGICVEGKRIKNSDLIFELY